MIKTMLAVAVLALSGYDKSTNTRQYQTQDTYTQEILVYSTQDTLKLYDTILITVVRPVQINK